MTRAVSRIAVVAATVTIAAVSLSAPPAWGAAKHVPCDGAHGGAAGLVAAINAANAGTGPTAIVLAQGCTYSVTDEDDIPDGGGLPAVTSSLSIGAPAPKPTTTIARADSAPAFSVINVDAPGALALSNVTVTGGLAVDHFVGAGLSIASGAALTLDHCRVTGNRATASTAALASGAGIYSNGTVSVVDSRVDHNSVVDEASGGLAIGGGITSEGFTKASPAVLHIRGSRIDHNTVIATGAPEPGAVGGGVAVLGIADTNLVDSHVDSNRARGRGQGSAAIGGGLFFNLSFYNGKSNIVAAVDGGTVSRNTVHAAGGGLAGGGGIYAADGVQLQVGKHGAVGRNTATMSGDAGTAFGGGVFADVGATVTIAAAHLLGNRAVASGIGVLAAGGAIANLGHSVVGASGIDGNGVFAAGDGALARGGGVYNSSGDSPGGGLTIGPAQIRSNMAAAADGAVAGGGGLYQDSGPLTVNPHAQIVQNSPDNRE